MLKPLFILPAVVLLALLIFALPAQQPTPAPAAAAFIPPDVAQMVNPAKPTPETLARAKKRLRHVRAGVDWYFPVEEDLLPSAEPQEIVRLLAPFDPVVHDRARFELLWGWQYRFEAYTPIAKRKLGYYAMPLLGTTA